MPSSGRLAQSSRFMNTAAFAGPRPLRIEAHVPGAGDIEGVGTRGLHGHCLASGGFDLIIAWLPGFEDQLARRIAVNSDTGVSEPAGCQVDEFRSVPVAV